MLKFGKSLDERYEIRLDYSPTDKDINRVDLPASNLKIWFERTKYGLHERKSEFLFPSKEEYTFRNYGKLKDFSWDNEGKLVTTKSHLEYIKNSPKLSVKEIDREVIEGRVYGLDPYYLARSDDGLSLASGKLKLVRLDNTKNSVYLSRYHERDPASDIQRFLDMIAEADVIALYTNVNNDAYCHIILHVDNNTKIKIFLDKLMTIYREDRMRRYLAKYNITLGMVLDNLDLYHCLSFGL